MGDFTAFFQDWADGNPLNNLSASLTGNIEKDLEELKLGENAEGIGFIGMAYCAVEVPGSLISKSFGSRGDIVYTVKFPRNYTPVMTEGADPTMTRGPTSTNGHTPTYFPSSKDSSGYGDYKSDNIDLCPDTEVIAVFKRVHDAMPIWKKWFFHLLGSHQTKPLTKGHVSAYFAMNGTPNVDGESFAKLFPGLTPGMESIPAIAALRAMMDDNKWVSYRMTFAAAIGLLTKMLQELPKDYLKVFSAETISAIRASEANKADSKLYRVIPEKALAILVAYLKVTKELPEKLWGPERAYLELTYQEKESLKNYFEEAVSKIVIYKTGPIFNRGTLPNSITGV